MGEGKHPCWHLAIVRGWRRNPRTPYENEATERWQVTGPANARSGIGMLDQGRETVVSRFRQFSCNVMMKDRTWKRVGIGGITEVPRLTEIRWMQWIKVGWASCLALEGDREGIRCLPVWTSEPEATAIWARQGLDGRQERRSRRLRLRSEAPASATWTWHAARSAGKRKAARKKPGTGRSRNKLPHEGGRSVATWWLDLESANLPM
ncbi:hypothetical protein BDP67DRAFT_222473 [Colletotrichum lupini]|nr:hypothetical protein BDP67DRAFT_222473 [Colletotrichum lupini]